MRCRLLQVDVATHHKSQRIGEKYHIRKIWSPSFFIKIPKLSFYLYDRAPVANWFQLFFQDWSCVFNCDLPILKGDFDTFCCKTNLNLKVTF